MTRYLFLVPCAVAALLLLLFVRRKLDRLTAPSPCVGALESGTLLLVLGVGFVTIYGSFLLGDTLFAYRDVGLDTVDLYVPFYIDLLDSIREGTFGTWNFGYGLGASVLSYQSWILDPFNVVLVPLGLLLGNECLPLVLVLVQALKIVVAGLLFQRLLTRFCETPLARVMGSSCYAFCGYTLLWGQHYWLGGMCALFALVLLLLERLAARWTPGRFASVALATAVCLGWSPYCGFMIMGCAAIYMLLRLFHLAPQRGVLGFVGRRTLRLLAPVLCGCLMACVTLVPYALYLFGETSRTSAASQGSLLSRAAEFATEFVPLDWIPLLVSRFLGSGLVTSGDAIPDGMLTLTESFPQANVYEFVCMGFGGLSIVLLLQFAHWVWTEASRRDRALIGIAAVLALLYCVNSFLPALLNIFVVPRFRSSFALAVPVCIALAIAWERRVQARRVALAPLVIGVSATIASLVWSAANTVDGMALCVALLGFALVASGLLAALSRVRRWDVPLLGVASLVLASVLADGFFVTNNRVVCTVDDFPGATLKYSGDTEDALAWIAQQDDSLYRVEKTYCDWGLYNDALVQGYLGVSSYNSTLDGEVGELFKLFWPSSVGSGGSSISYLESDDPRSLASLLGVRYLLSREHQPEPYELLATFGEINVYRNGSARGILFGSASVVGESEVRSLGTAEERRVALEEGVVVPDEVASNFGSSSDNDTIIADLTLEAGQVVTGTFESSEDSVACLSIPHTAGWHVLVDGREVDTYRVDLGLIGFTAEAGSHTIEAYYSIPGLEMGCAALGIGALSVGVVAAASLLRRCGRETSSRSEARG